MKIIKKYIDEIFVEAMTGMSKGLFPTLVIGIILYQIAFLVGGTIGEYIQFVSELAMALTGAGIGVGVALCFKENTLTTVSACICGMVGAYASKMLSNSIMFNGRLIVDGPGEPLSAFIAAYVGIKFAQLVSEKTHLDVLVIPFVSIITGSAAGFFVGPHVTKFMTMIGEVIMWATDKQPIVMGIVVAVLMGMIATSPVSTVALGVILNISGIAAGAATVGCCCNMIGFAIASFRENRWGGLILQGIGTSMVQMDNIRKRPVIWLPAIITSAILGPISTFLLGMTNNPTGAGIGSAGFVGQIMTYQNMVSEGFHSIMVIIEIGIMHFVAPSVLALLISEIMRKHKWIKEGDMKVDLQKLN